MDIINNLSYKARKDNLLSKISGNILAELGLTPIVGIEIEFYAERIGDIPAIYNLKEEKGNNQFEIDILPMQDLEQLIAKIDKAKAHLSKHCKNISFHPKPYDDYGSAMHFHINFIDQNGENFFDSQTKLEHAAKSLCHFMLPTFLIFAPEEHYYKRFDEGSMAPTHVCHGGNNRTVAVRIPDAKPRRLEHRLSAPETDAYLALCAIMQSIYLGFKNPETIGDHTKIYGNAFDEQYELPMLPKKVKEAMELFDEGIFDDVIHLTKV